MPSNPIATMGPELIRALGPRPEGDPAALLQYATALESVAHDVAAGGRKGRTALEHATFVGPAGDRARAQGHHLGTRAGHTAHELRDLAADVKRRAAHVQHLQAVWDRAQRELIATTQNQPTPGRPVSGGRRS